MRIAGFIALVIFFPAFAHAADAPTLKVYTISQSTVYPSVTIESGLATTTSIDIAFYEQVKASIKIMSASGALIKSLYSSSGVINPEPRVWDGTDKNGVRVVDGTYTILISATSTATNQSMTDSSKTVMVSSPGGSAPPDTTSATTETNSANSAPPEYLSIPMLHINTVDNHTVSSGADTAFTATVYDGKGNKRDDAVVSWSFGDGMRRTGASVFHQYYSSGEYLAIVRAITTDGGNAQKEVAITVKDASIKISLVSPRGITLANNDSRTLDLSFWRLSAGGQEFKIPEDTQILAGRTILFPSQVIELPITNLAFLLYPSGEVAASFPAPMKDLGGLSLVQPQPVAASYEQVQKVEPITSPKEYVPVYEKAVIAPRASNELAALGAALPPEPPASASRAAGIFKSPWTLGFIGTVLLAGGAFILL